MSDANDPMDAVREAARRLRPEPDDAMVARIRAGVAARLASPPSIIEILAAWARPIAALTAAVLVLVAAAWTFAPELLAPDLTETAGAMLLDEVFRGLY